MIKRGRTALADKQREFGKTERLYAALAGVPVRADLVIPAERSERVKRAVKQSAERLEAPIQAEIIEWLLANPRVHGLKRINKGVAVESDNRRIEYCHVYGKFNGQYMTALDLEFWFMTSMFSQRPRAIPVEIEVKREFWTPPNTMNRTVAMQWARIQYVRAHFGISGFCTSIADVEKLLNDA